jgi:hypothetical protein
MNKILESQLEQAIRTILSEEAVTIGSAAGWAYDVTGGSGTLKADSNNKIKGASGFVAPVDGTEASTVTRVWIKGDTGISRSVQVGGVTFSVTKKTDAKAAEKKPDAGGGKKPAAPAPSPADAMAELYAFLVKNATALGITNADPKSVAKNAKTILDGLLAASDTTTPLKAWTAVDQTALRTQLSKLSGQLPTNWQGTTLTVGSRKVEFPAGPQGLIELVKLAYVVNKATTAADGAKDIGIGVINPDTTDLTGPAFQAIRLFGVLSPVLYAGVKGPDDGSIKTGDVVYVEVGSTGRATSARTVPKQADTVIFYNFERDFPLQGVSAADFIIAQEGSNAAEFDAVGAEAAKAVEAMFRPTTWTLKRGEQLYTVKKDSFNFGDVIEFAEKPPAEGPATSGTEAFNTMARGSRYASSIRGITDYGTKNFNFRSIYPGRDGSLKSNEVGASLTKTTSRKGDQFRLTVTNPTNDIGRLILVPVTLRGPIREHWTKRFITDNETFSGGGASTIALMPVTELSFNFDANYYKYGTEVPNVSTVSFTPYEGSSEDLAKLAASSGLNIVSAEDLQVQGMDQEYLDRAVRDYLTSPGNPNSGPMLATRSLTDIMNSYPRAGAKTF